MRRSGWALGVLAVAVVGCQKTAVPAPVDAVGPAPLRRLTNSEYANVLGDLFGAAGEGLVLPALPGETVVGGLENAAETQRPSDVLVARFEETANAYAAQVMSKPEWAAALIGCDPAAPGCAGEFLTRFGRRVFRRPLTAEEYSRFFKQFAAWQREVDFEGAVQLTVSALLQSPQFLYRPELAESPVWGPSVEVEPYNMASRLSFLLWESAPDETLLAAAEKGELHTVEQISAQVERLSHDPRARRVFWSFHRQWLGLERVLQDEHAVRTAEIDPGWSALSQTSAVEESKRFVSNVLFDDGTFRSVLTSRRAWVNSEMARVYGVSVAAGPNDWVEASLDPAQRSGLLSRVAYLAGFSHRGATSPPIRANEIQLKLLCQSPHPPPPNLDTTPPAQLTDGGAATNRQLFEARTASSVCMGCHTALNGIGFGLEHYSASGAYQATDHGLPVNATGHLAGSAVDRDFDGAVDLAEALSESPVMYDCATSMWLRYALGRAPTEAEQPWQQRLSAHFAQTHGDVRALLVDIATGESFRKRPTEVLP